MPPVNTPEEGVFNPEAAHATLSRADLPSRSAFPSQSTSAVPSPDQSRPATGRTSPVPHDASATIKWQELDYVDAVDDALICPICKTPFHQPVTTRRCGHTFCAECLRRAHDRQPTCPVDREPLRFPRDVVRLTRVVADQVARLRVRCPHAGCGAVVTRDDLPAHCERVCNYTPVPCPSPGCGQLVARRDSRDDAQPCLHRRLAPCQYCGARVVAADLETHYEKDCEGHTVPCPKCGTEVVRHVLARHARAECPEEMTQCRWASSGCRHSNTRKAMESHEEECIYRTISALVTRAEEDRRTIEDLVGEVASLRKELMLRERQTPLAGPGPKVTDFIPDLDLAGPSPRTAPVPLCTGTLTAGPWENSDEYLLAQFERMETNYDELRKTQTEMDGRHSMMLLNETIPIKEQLAELRSNMGVIGMHTTWLMNMMRQNRGQQQHASGSGSAATSTPGEDGGSNRQSVQSRRGSSDGRGEPPPRL